MASIINDNVKDFEEPNPSEINIKKFIIIAGCAFISQVIFLGRFVLVFF